MKGSIFDVLVIAVLLLTLSIGILVASIIMTQVQTSTAETLSTEAAQTALQQGMNAVNTFNYGFVIIAFGLGIGSVIFAFIVPSHPIFMIVSIIALMIFMIIIPQFSNAYGLIKNDSTFSTASANFGLMNFIMDNLPLFCAVFGVLIMIALYTRWQSSGQA